jgi:hypothetical protein
MKVRIGYTNRYIDVDNSTEASTMRDLGVAFEDLFRGFVACSYCRAKIIPDDYVVLVHNPKEDTLPIRLHFFCYKEDSKKDCRLKWVELAKQDRTKTLNGGFQNERG